MNFVYCIHICYSDKSLQLYICFSNNVYFIIFWTTVSGDSKIANEKKKKMYCLIFLPVYNGGKQCLFLMKYRRNGYGVLIHTTKSLQGLKTQSKDIALSLLFIWKSNSDLQHWAKVHISLTVQDDLLKDVWKIIFTIYQ